MKVKTLFSVVCVSLGLLGCVTPTVGLGLSDNAGRMGIGDARLGDQRGSVLTAASAEFGTAPKCETKKVLVKNSRRAYALETCTFSDIQAELADIKVNNLDYYFIDDLLQRIDLLADGDSVDMEVIKSHLDKRFGRIATVSDSDQGLYLWQNSQDQAQLQPITDSAQFQLKVIDTNAAVKAF
ncbi:MAG: hypothetical protein KTR35_09115 [Gammaproteobacteria bacterium]|nr:hypothetical protein [Gammaproteobacteria bacterium]